MMKFYCSITSSKCREILKKINSDADIDLIIVKPRIGVDGTYYPVKNEIISELKEIPTLIDGDKIIEGEKILNYLAGNTTAAKFLI